MTIRQPQLRRPGVTLIETILVIILLAAAAVTGLIIFDGQWVARRGAKLATVDVASTLATARNTSIAAAAPVSVTRSEKNGRQQLLIVEQPGPYRVGKSWSVDLGTESRISGNPISIQFNADGTADRRLDWKVSQQSSTGEIKVSPVSGLVSKKLP